MPALPSRRRLLTPQDKEAFEVSVVQSLVENVKRQEKELKELRKQLQEAKDETEIKELKAQLEDANQGLKELEVLREKLEAANRQEKETQKLKAQLEDADKGLKELEELKSKLEAATEQEKEKQETRALRDEQSKATYSKQEKEIQKLKSQLAEANRELEEANRAMKGTRDERAATAQAGEKDPSQSNGQGVVPQLSEVESIAKRTRKGISQINVSASDSSEVLALAVMGAAENFEQLGDALDQIEQKLHKIIEQLQAK